jgi:hypothetical protein
VKELSDKFGIKDREAIKKIAGTFIQKVKTQSVDSPTKIPTSNRKKGEENPAVSEHLKEELQHEKERNEKLQQDYEKLVQDYDNLAKKEVPNFDDLKAKIVNETIVKEREKHEKEKSIILRDLQKRVDKVNYFLFYP